MVAEAVTARMLPNSIAYVKLFTFTANAANQVFAALKGPAMSAAPRGIVLDLRGNPGGEEAQAVRLVSAFVHHRIVGYQVGGNGQRDALHTDDTVALLHAPLVVLTDGGSASSSELVASAVRDLRLGRVVGSRTAAEIAGAYFYSLSDGSALEITQFHIFGANGEKLDRIGVTPGQQVAATAADLSAGDDPVIDRAVQDIEHATGQG
jgi:carboxyl-terminal processing protease